MSQIRIVEPPEEKFSWVNEIVGLEVGEKFKTPKKYRKTVAPIISRDVKVKDPDGEFETDTKSETEYLIIARIK
jgi:hypothetical protein